MKREKSRLSTSVCSNGNEAASASLCTRALVNGFFDGDFCDGEFSTNDERGGAESSQIIGL